MIKIVKYSEKSIALKGDTKPVKEDIKALNGRFNRFLTDSETGEKFAGWIFPIGKKKQVVDELSKNGVEIEDFI